MPKKMMPKSQAKNQTPFAQYPLFNYYLTPKKRYHANKYIIISLFARFKYIYT